MFNKLSNSWELVKASAQVLKADKELVVFPLLSFGAFLLTLVVFFLPLAFFNLGSAFADSSGVATVEIMAYVFGFLFYFITTFIMIFFNSALVGAALIRLDGGDPTVADGLRIARQHLGAILGWSLLAASVGMILKAARERAGWLGSVVVGMIGIAWNLATFLVVPVLVTHNLGPIDALKESARLLKKTWGEQIAGNLGIGAVVGLAFLLYSLIAVPIIVLAVSTGTAALIIAAIVCVALGYGALALVSATLSGIYSAALYRFATTGEAGFIDRRLLQQAFQPK
ncbi:MAG: DUF6159 family protein [Thermoanaerobaculia bacterium]|nr:DUF6159 family protein [Thermoanaerobaculia bacterium]